VATSKQQLRDAVGDVGLVVVEAVGHGGRSLGLLATDGCSVPMNTLQSQAGSPCPSPIGRQTLAGTVLRAEDHGSGPTLAPAGQTASFLAVKRDS
jgi:hypothetical protein